MPQLSSVNAYDYALIALYFGIVIWVGFYSAKKNKGTDDYFKAGGKVPWFMAGVSNWVSGFSAFMFVAAAGYTYKHGGGALILFTAAFWAYLAGYYYFAPAWRRARIDAPLEFLTRRYSPSTSYFYTVMSIFPQVLGIAQGLYILCIFVSAALGLDREMFNLVGIEFSGLQVCMMAVGAVMIIYSVVGGLWAAVLSDAVQGVIILVMSLLIFPISMSYIGNGGGFMAGLNRLFAELPQDYLVPSGEPMNPWFLGAYMINIFLGYNVAWHLVQRYNSVPTERDAKKMAMLCAWLSLLAPTLWALPVMASKLIFPDMAVLWPHLKAPEEASFVSLAMLLLPHGLIGFVVAAILSATLGQANDAFNWLAAATTKDVYVPARRKLGFGESSDKHQLFVAQLTMLVVGVAGVALSFVISKLGGAFEFALKYHSIVGPGFMMPVMLGLLYRKTPWWSGMAACLAAFTASLTLFALDVLPAHAMPRNVLSAVIASTTVFVISAFFYRPDDPRSAETIKLDRDLRTPVPGEEHKETGGLRDYVMLSWVSALLGVVLLGCGLLPAVAPASARSNVIAGVLLLVIAGLLRRVARARA